VVCKTYHALYAYYPALLIVRFYYIHSLCCLNTDYITDKSIWEFLNLWNLYDLGYKNFEYELMSTFLEFFFLGSVTLFVGLLKRNWIIYTVVVYKIFFCSIVNEKSDVVYPSFHLFVARYRSIKWETLCNYIKVYWCKRADGTRTERVSIKVGLYNDISLERQKIRMQWRFLTKSQSTIYEL
jgi:hypothetical protein